MPRSNSATELVKEIKVLGVSKFVETSGTHGSTTTSGNVAKGSATLPFTSITNFADNDFVIVNGDGGVELNQIDGTPNATMPMEHTVAFAQTAGATIVEATQLVLGHLDEAGFTFGASQQETSIFSSTARVALTVIRGPAELRGSFNLRGWNNLNLQTFFGITEGETGAGTLADPYQMSVGLNDPSSHGLQCFRFEGFLIDGRTWQIDLCNCIVVANSEIQAGSTSGSTVIPVSFRFTNLVSRIWT